MYDRDLASLDVFSLYSCAKELKYKTKGNKEKSIKWGRNTVLSSMLSASSMLMLLFCFISWIVSLKSVIAAIPILVLGVYLCYTVTRTEIKKYWDGVHSKEAEENKKMKIEETKTLIKQLIMSWFDENAGRKLFDGVRFLGFDSVIGDPTFGDYFCNFSSEHFKNSPLKKIKLGSVMGIVPSLFSMSIIGDKDEIIMIDFTEMDNDLVSEISSKAGGSVKKCRIVTQKSKNVYHVFVVR